MCNITMLCPCLRAKIAATVISDTPTMLFHVIKICHNTQTHSSSMIGGLWHLRGVARSVKVTGYCLLINNNNLIKIDLFNTGATYRNEINANINSTHYYTRQYYL